MNEQTEIKPIWFVVERMTNGKPDGVYRDNNFMGTFWNYKLHEVRWWTLEEANKIHNDILELDSEVLGSRIIQISPVPENES